MKKHFRWLVAAAMTLTLLGCGGALAAESAITVQLDGQALTFTDAVPQVKDQRTFLPFRAVFEAMGAQVSNEGSVITATREGKTLTMTLDSTEATLTQGDKTAPIAMDVAPYVDSATWRTYVPVRFAAQAFDCAVGWDQEASTVIIVDTDKVLDAALEGKSFTYLEKLMNHSEKYNEGTWDMEASFDADMSVMAMPMTMAGTMKGTMAGGEKMDMDMNMKMDLTEYVRSVALLTQMGGGAAAEPITPEDQAMLDDLKENGIDLSMRGDMGLGKLYMNMNGDFLTAAGMNGEDWYQLDMAALMAQSGMDWAQLMEVSKDMDYAALAKQALSSMELTDSAAAYGQVKTTVEQLLTALSDQGFVKEGDDYTALVELEEDGVGVTVVLVMNMDGDTVTNYVVSMHMEATEDGTTVSMDMTTGMDDKDQMTAEMNMDLAGLLTMKLTMEGSYAPGQAAPQVEPPAGANVVDLMELMAAELEAEGTDLGVIGGADGPTAVLVAQ